MLALYQKYRPTKFSQVAGQEHVIRTLTNAIANKRIGHAYLLTGPRGTGKTTLARIFSKTINCLEPIENKKGSNLRLEPCNKCENCRSIMEGKTLDVVEIDAASHTGVDNIRQLRETVPIPPSLLKYKVYIIDEVHMLSIGAFNALLKTLEEPPKHAIFILATTELHKVPETIISRCQRFDITLLNQKQIVDYLRKIAEKEGVEIEDEALETIALEADGGMRDAQSILGQIISLEDKKVTAKEVNDILGTSSRKIIIDFVKLLTEKKLAKALESIEKLQEEGINLRNFNKSVLSFLRIVLLSKTSDEAGKKSAVSLSEEQLKETKSISKKLSLRDVLELLDLFSRSFSQFKETIIPQLPLELATIKYCSDQELTPKVSIPSPSNPVTIKAPLANNIRKFEKRSTPSPIENKVISKPQIESKTLESAQKKEAPKADTPKTPVLEMPTDLVKRKISLSEVLDNWFGILELIKPENRSIHAFLTNCNPCGVIDETIYIKTRYDFYKDKLSENENKLTVQKTTATILGAVLKIAFVTEKESSNMSFDEEESTDQNHNILHDAMKVLGGKIIKD